MIEEIIKSLITTLIIEIIKIAIIAVYDEFKRPKPKHARKRK